MAHLELSERVERLERSARRWRAAALVLLAAGVGGVCLAAAEKPAAVPDVLQAKRIEVVGDDGKAVVRLGSVDGSGIILVKNGQGKLAISASGIKEGGGLALYSADGTKGVMLQSIDLNGGSIAVSDEKGHEIQHIPPVKR